MIRLRLFFVVVMAAVEAWEYKYLNSIIIILLHYINITCWLMALMITQQALKV